MQQERVETVVSWSVSLTRVNVVGMKSVYVHAFNLPTSFIENNVIEIN